jgi:hypothetical protein
VKKAFKKPVPIGSSPNIAFNRQTVRSQPAVTNSMAGRNREIPKVTPIESVEKETMAEKPQTSQDWLKPKIFKGGGLI